MSPSENGKSIVECREILRHNVGAQLNFELVAAAATLMELCESNPDVTIDDGLMCLDYAGVVAEYGARILYVQTGRDGLGWRGAGANGLPFIVDKADWLRYLGRAG